MHEAAKSKRQQKLVKQMTMMRNRRRTRLMYVCTQDIEGQPASHEK